MNLASSASPSSAFGHRYSQSEIKYFSTVNITELQAQVDRLSRECRELDTTIQAANWNTELID
ncbi:hypothetical protein [[Phormidium ambiguum] IAM M-71]|uniref:DIP1984 family protein n=1 Tax=[Phormidium ambiguum] IAM M-71 TaxID=454136 RepID=UPI002E820AE9|nr:hypothetical protein [Phormidium ambiguum]